MTASSYSKELKSNNKNCADVTINDIPVKGFVDSGNLCPCAISADFFGKLGFKAHDLKPVLSPVGTAKKQTSLDVMGRLKFKVCLKFNKCSKTKYYFRPLVIKDLSMDVNLSLSFLKKK